MFTHTDPSSPSSWFAIGLQSCMQSFVQEEEFHGEPAWVTLQDAHQKGSQTRMATATIYQPSKAFLFTHLLPEAEAHCTMWCSRRAQCYHSCLLRVQPGLVALLLDKPYPLGDSCHQADG